MRLPSLERDHWELRSAELAHQQHPDTFWIPTLAQRQNIRRGQAAKVIIDLEGRDQRGAVQVGGERMWVIVAERVGDFYIGILDNQPASLAPADDVYLCFGAEIPFLPLHVIDIRDPPPEYAQWQLNQEPARRWPRDLAAG